MDSSPRNRIACTLLGLFILLIYSNSFHSEWHFDDFHNIVRNPRITISDLNPHTLKMTLFAASNSAQYNGTTLYRPLPMFTFALNWYMGDGNVFGFHLVNLTVHLLAAIFLFLTIQELFKTPVLRDYQENAYHTALLSALLWAVHPIQIQAVTFIVQRMAAMSALFYFCSIYFYLKARLSDKGKKGNFTLCGLSFLAAMCSKENAATFPVAIGLLEIIFFIPPADPNRRRYQRWGLSLLVTLTAVGAAFFVMNGNFSGMLDEYRYRSFTLSERLMTQPRVICLYFYQIVYPVASQFSISHGIEISTNLRTPWTTLPAILFLVLLIWTGLIGIKRSPLVSFALLFFFLNHVIESSFIPLELVFEHRNYLPMAFLFVPFFNRLTGQIRIWRKNEKLVPTWSAGLLLATVFFSLGLGTYARNMDWQTEKSLWESAMIKAPNNARPYQNLAIGYYKKNNMLDEAIPLLEKAAMLWDNKPVYSKMVSYGNLCRIFNQKQDWEKAAYNGKLAVEASHRDFVVNHYLQALIMGGHLKDAQTVMETYLADSEKVSILNIKTLIYIKTGQLERAWSSALQTLKRTSSDGTALAQAGYICLALGRYEKAERFFKQAMPLFGQQEQLVLILACIETSARAGQKDKAEQWVSLLVETYAARQIIETIKAVQNESFPLFQFKNRAVFSEIANALTAQTKEVNALSVKADGSN